MWLDLLEEEIIEGLDRRTDEGTRDAVVCFKVLPMDRWKAVLELLDEDDRGEDMQHLADAIKLSRLEEKTFPTRLIVDRLSVANLIEHSKRAKETLPPLRKSKGKEPKVEFMDVGPTGDYHGGERVPPPKKRKNANKEQVKRASDIMAAVIRVMESELSTISEQLAKTKPPSTARQGALSPRQTGLSEEAEEELFSVDTDVDWGEDDHDTVGVVTIKEKILVIPKFLDLSLLDTMYHHLASRYHLPVIAFRNVAHAYGASIKLAKNFKRFVNNHVLLSNQHDLIKAAQDDSVQVVTLVELIHLLPRSLLVETKGKG
jgi:hypothetical protein